MNVRSDLAFAYMIGYDDAIAKRMPDSSKAGILNSYSCTSSERTTTVDETDAMECVCDGIGRYGKRVIIHVMECTECGHVYEHVNGDYEYCPRCGRKRRDVEE